MRVGTKSVLYGAHCVLIHPFVVAAAWWRLFGFPRDARLWLAFLVHDLGYLGKVNMDGPEGETHVELGGKIMAKLCGDRWGNFCRRHSRHWCKLTGRPYSRLCLADKLAFAMTPAWLYLPMAKATGELAEYIAVSRTRQAGAECFTDLEAFLVSSPVPRLWFEGLTSYTRRWVERQRWLPKPGYFEEVDPWHHEARERNEWAWDWARHHLVEQPDNQSQLGYEWQLGGKVKGISERALRFVTAVELEWDRKEGGNLFRAKLEIEIDLERPAVRGYRVSRPMTDARVSYSICEREEARDGDCEAAKRILEVGGATFVTVEPYRAIVTRCPVARWELIEPAILRALAPWGAGDEPSPKLKFNEVSDPWLNFKPKGGKVLRGDSEMPRDRLQ